MSFYKPRGDNTVKKLYKTELHCHTGDTSLCGRATAEELLERYLEKGYSTVVVTDHFCKMTFMRSKKYLNFIAYICMFLRMDAVISGKPQENQLCDGNKEVGTRKIKIFTTPSNFTVRKI